MAKQEQTTDTKVVFIKGSRILTYIVYAYSLTASLFLAVGFFLLLFSANQSTPFVKFVYETAAFFLQPFRGIFPLRSAGETGYFSASALFAIVMYLLLALGMHALIAYLTTKMLQFQTEVDKEEKKLS